MMQDTMVLKFPMDTHMTAAPDKPGKKSGDMISHFGMQRKIVSHMTSESWKTVPHVTYMYEPDVTDFMKEYRILSRDSNRSHKITVNTIMLKAIAEGLKAAPSLNAHIDYRDRTVRGTVTQLERIDISVPWCLPNGEMMTVNLRDVGSKSLDELAEYIEDVGRRMENTDFNEAMYEVAFAETMTHLKHLHIVRVLRRLFGTKVGKHRVKTLSGKAKRAYHKIPVGDRLTKADMEQGSVTVSNIGSIYREQHGATALLEIVPPQIFAVA
uniref:2-oxo acid dehydrogenase subunit E2 n=1 Tax=Candidatus Fimivicinus sp. TaxID=3056640 RepID=UPI003FEE665A